VAISCIRYTPTVQRLSLSSVKCTFYGNTGLLLSQSIRIFAPVIITILSPSRTMDISRKLDKKTSENEFDQSIFN